MPIVLKSRSLSLLEPSGAVQACNGIALLLPLPYLQNYVLYVPNTILCIMYVPNSISGKKAFFFRKLRELILGTDILAVVFLPM